MIRTILWFIYFWALLLQLIPRMIRGQRYVDRGQLEQLSALVGQVVPTWARRLLWAAGVTVELKGKEHMPPDPALYVANHQGNFDIPLLLANLGEPKGIVAKLSLAKFPLVSTWMRYFGCVFIDRGDARQSLRVLGDAQRQLEEGKSIIIFPEGTRSKGEAMGEFKAAAFKIAFQSGVPIVPVSIDGTYRIMEQNGNRIRPGKVKLTILPPIPTEGLSKEDQKFMGERVKALIQETRTE